MAVYFIQNRDTKRIKIGHTSGDPFARLVELQIGSDAELLLVATIDGGRAEELAWHARFSAQRVRGEWFEGSEALLEAVLKAVTDEAGDEVDIFDFMGFLGPPARMPFLNEQVHIHKIAGLAAKRIGAE